MDGAPVTIVQSDGTRLVGHVWRGRDATRGTVVINPATGVLARYYHRYARFLAAEGFIVLTYDYRGIGLSRVGRMRDVSASWRTWGEQDFDAALGWLEDTNLPRPWHVVGHSIGGALIGFAPRASKIDRILTVGAQYAYWRDYAAVARRRLFWRWHVLMPALTAAAGYFPGRQLGWLEDLPAGVAWEWSRKGRKLEASYRAADQAPIRDRFAAVTAPILALSMTDDEFGTEAALARTLRYYSGAERRLVMLPPSVLGETAVGHFAPFHGRLADSLWPATSVWLRTGASPWPESRVFPKDTRFI